MKYKEPNYYRIDFYRCGCASLTIDKLASVKYESGCEKGQYTYSTESIIANKKEHKRKIKL